jgi:hypothetical protein
VIEKPARQRPDCRGPCPDKFADARVIEKRFCNTASAFGFEQKTKAESDFAVARHRSWRGKRSSTGWSARARGPGSRSVRGVSAAI